MSRRIGSTLVPRNPVARSLMERRGGAHQKSKSSVRHQRRIKVGDQIQSWREDLAFERGLQQRDDLD